MAAFVPWGQSSVIQTEVCRSENTYYLIFYRKSLLTPVVITTVLFDVWLAGSLWSDGVLDGLRDSDNRLCLGPRQLWDVGYVG